MLTRLLSLTNLTSALSSTTSVGVGEGESNVTSNSDIETFLNNAKKINKMVKNVILNGLNKGFQLESIYLDRWYVIYMCL